MHTKKLFYYSIPLFSLFLFVACVTTRPVPIPVVQQPVKVVDTVAEEGPQDPIAWHPDEVPADSELRPRSVYNINNVAKPLPYEWQTCLQQRLDSLCNIGLFETTMLGLCVYDLTDGRMLYSVNERQRMRPASNMKLVTAITVLDTLGTRHRYVPTVRKPGWGWCWDDEETGITDFGFAGVRKDTAVLYAEDTARTIGDVLTPMMKKSDNMLAESMFWLLPDTSIVNPTRSDCAIKVNRLIERIGLNPTDYVIADGSGVSLYNYVTPQLLLRLLRYAYHHKPIYSALYPALPIAGVDGTLSKRMRGTSTKGNVHAKTGTVTGVSSLSGYCKHPSGHMLCFSIVNQGIPSSSVGRNFQDEVCVVLTSK